MEKKSTGVVLIGPRAEESNLLQDGSELSRLSQSAVNTSHGSLATCESGTCEARPEKGRLCVPSDQWLTINPFPSPPPLLFSLFFLASLPFPTSETRSFLVSLLYHMK
jgi:hypothetical protein